MREYDAIYEVQSVKELGVLEDRTDRRPEIHRLTVTPVRPAGTLLSTLISPSPITFCLTRIAKPS